jgi:hypothetical protein
VDIRFDANANALVSMLTLYVILKVTDAAVSMFLSIRAHIVARAEVKTFREALEKALASHSNKDMN